MWPVWVVAVGIFILAMFHRTSLGVAGPLAAHRFSLSAAQLSTFLMLQLGVYAAMQVPSGILIDRFGPRRMLLVATLTMGFAQISFALVPNYGLALAARGILGCGDALTYLSVLRVIAARFPPRRYAFMTSLTGVLGMAGNLLSTLPLTLMLGHAGWTTTFLAAGSVSVAYAALLLRPVVRLVSGSARGSGPAGPNAEPIAARTARAARRSIWRETRAAWSLPTGHLAFWLHFCTVAGPQAFTVLWGFPYLVQGLGYTATAASALLLVLVACGGAGNLLVGVIAGRFPAARVPLVFGAVSVFVADWTVLAMWPGGRVPDAVIVVILVTFACGRPTSIIGFLLVRDANPPDRVSTATALVNVGGHIGTVLVVYGIGQVLDLVDVDATTHSLTAFRWAFAAVAIVVAFGLTRMIVWRSRSRHPGAAVSVRHGRGHRSRSAWVIAAACSTARFRALARRERRVLCADSHDEQRRIADGEGGGGNPG